MGQNWGKGLLESERTVGYDVVGGVDITCLLDPWGQCYLWTWACLAGLRLCYCEV